MSGSDVVALAPGPASALVSRLRGTGGRLEGDAARARSLLLAVDRPSGAPALLEDVAVWADRAASGLADRIAEVVRLDTAVPSGLGPRRASEWHLDVRRVADVEELLWSLVRVGVLDACPPPGDVRARRRTLGRLDPELLGGLARQIPRVLGGADGLPVHVRDRANRRLLARAIAGLERRAPLAGPERRLLAQLRAWRDDADLALVKLDLGRGRAVLARGDLDRATHVAAIVPGAGTTLAALSRRHTGWMDRLHAAVQRRLAVDGRSGRVATVLWLDYDAPERLVPDAALGSAAGDAAQRLPDFLAGLERPGRRLVTVLGHSYGSVVLGRTLAERPGEVAADQLVALGSPGLGVQTARPLRLREDQRLFAATFAGDPVAYAGRFLPVVGDLGRAVHGPDPRRLEDAETIALSTHDLEVEDPAALHGQYFAEGSSALATLADLAAGGPVRRGE